MLQYLPHVYYGLTALSFAVRDVIWLRCLAIIASSLQITYELMLDQPRHATIMWSGVFIGFNTYRILRMVLGERAVRFSAEERELHETLFRNFTKLEFMRLMRAGTWKSAAPGEEGAVLARQGEPVTEVMLIFRGMAEVRCGDQAVAQLRDGQLIGEMSFLTGEPASATVTVTQPTRYIAWDKEKLRTLRTRNPSLRFAMDAVIGTDLSRKLKRS